MRPRGPWKRARTIIDRIYQQSACVSYAKFKRKWYIGRPPIDGHPSLPAQQTFSHFWRDYVQQNNLQKLEGELLTEWLENQFGQRNLDPGCNRPELEEQIIILMVDNKYVKPAAYRFQRCLSAALKSFRPQI